MESTATSRSRATAPGGTPEEVLAGLYRRYWTGLLDDETTRWEIARHAFHIHLIRGAIGESGAVCDVGGGWGSFSSAMALLGYRSVLIDDCLDSGWAAQRDPRLQMPSESGVERIVSDVLAKPLPLETATMDAIACIHTIEHFPSSPRPMLREMIRALKPGGYFLLCAPNCVNLRKRLTVPLGHGKWSAIESWYDEAVFRGHVREPDTGDLTYIGRDLGLLDMRIFGRNWLGRTGRNPLIRAATAASDRVLRFWPSLCSDIYLEGRRP
ncbi:MAG: class I SAM-dependent methyltransferase [Bryobacteraceae bacterium]|nr:class I SAM-dependent methyltransferase [Bryobacteraceae bacterium]